MGSNRSRGVIAETRKVIGQKSTLGAVFAQGGCSRAQSSQINRSPFRSPADAPLSDSRKAATEAYFHNSKSGALGWSTRSDRAAGECRAGGSAAWHLGQAEARLRALGCVRVTLDTTEEPLTRAIAFYRRHGYAPTGCVQDFFGMPLHEFARDLQE